MKGVILSTCPQAQIVDISHQVTPFATAEGGFTIAQAYRYFPKSTVHIVVVDPGVGTARRPILMEAGGQRFVAPDNGVLSLIYAQEAHKVRLISNERYFRKPVSRTFHGRDIFAPAAAHVAAGVAPSRLGKIIHDYLRPEFAKPAPTGAGSWTGRILKIDRFGNLITNFHEREFSGLEEKSFSLAIGTAQIVRMARTYAEAGPGELFVIVGSSGYLEVSMNQGSAAKMVGCQADSAAELTIW
jgi:S-adenosylmethionine hydrolase